MTIGVDAHKQGHAAVALDERGRAIGRWRGAKSVDGWRAVAAWAAELGAACRWGIAGAWGNGRGLAQQLVAADAAVDAVNPRWTAAGRRGARRPGKHDRLNARAVALLVEREATTLPIVGPDDETAMRDLLVAERDTLVAESTRTRNQVHQLLQRMCQDWDNRSALAREGRRETHLTGRQAASISSMIAIQLWWNRRRRSASRLARRSWPRPGNTGAAPRRPSRSVPRRRSCRTRAWGNTVA